MIRQAVEEDVIAHTIIGRDSPTPLIKTMESDPGFLVAVEEAKAGFEEGGVPIGGCLVSKDGKILGRGRNLRVQKGSATLHVGSSAEAH